MRAHATPEQLAYFLGDTPIPPDAERLLERASELIDEHTTVGYQLDAATDLAKDSTVAEALANATCAQVEFWNSVGEAHDVEGIRGQVGLAGYRYAGPTPPTLAPRALRILVRAGLRGQGVVAI